MSLSLSTIRGNGFYWAAKVGITVTFDRRGVGRAKLGNWLKKKRRVGITLRAACLFLFVETRTLPEGSEAIPTNASSDGYTVIATAWLQVPPVGRPVPPVIAMGAPLEGVRVTLNPEGPPQLKPMTVSV